METWESHVIRVRLSDKGTWAITWCGIKNYGFMLQDVEHALTCVKTNSYVQPCPECLKVIYELDA